MLINFSLNCFKFTLKSFRLWLMTIFVLSSVTSYAETWQVGSVDVAIPDVSIEVAPLRQAINYSRGFSALPDLPADSDVFTDTSEKIPNEMLKTFLKFEQYFFGKTGQIKLSTCRGCMGGMMPKDKKVFIDLDFFEYLRDNTSVKVANEFTTFVMVHELAHFVQDLWTINHGTSPTGTPGKNSEKFTPGNKITAEYLTSIVQYQLGHAEVDAIAMVAMSDLNCLESAQVGFSELQQYLEYLLVKVKENPEFIKYPEIVFKIKLQLKFRGDTISMMNRKLSDSAGL